MKTKIIPFDLETAKKIQEGQIAGAIKTRRGLDAKLLYTNLDNEQPIVAIVRYEDSENTIMVSTDGHFFRTKEQSDLDLVLEVPDKKTQFKPFDRVLVRENDASLWRAGFYSHELDGNHCVCGIYYPQCIPYEGNEHLLGRTLQC